MRPLKKTLAWAVVRKFDPVIDIREYCYHTFPSKYAARIHLGANYEKKYWRIARVEIKEVTKNRYGK